MQELVHRLLLWNIMESFNLCPLWERNGKSLGCRQDIPKSYRAKIRIHEHMYLQKEKDASISAFTQNGNPEDSLLAGVVKHGDKLFKTWSEDVLNLQSVRVIAPCNPSLKLVEVVL